MAKRLRKLTPSPFTLLAFTVGYRPEIRRQHDFNQLQIVTMSQLGVSDPGWLMHAGTGFEGDLADTFVVKLHPALQNIDHLEFDFMVMAFRMHLGIRLCANDMGHHCAVRGVANTQVAVLEEGTQTVVPELAGLEMVDGELVAVVHVGSF